LADARRRGLPIIARNVRVARGDATLLDDVDVTIPADERTFILGPNGSGKSTLLRVLHGLQRPTAGEVLWGGAATHPSGQAMVFQRPVMLRRSARGNIRYVLRSSGVARAERNSRIGELLGLVGLEHIAHRPARRLSGGEQQRLALARALARDPIVLFLDEPTASLDPAATKAIEDLVHTISERGIKVVMSTHDIAEARRLAGEIIMLHHGRIVETGAAMSFFDAPKTDEAKKFLAGELLI